jgi:hypothetical protein
MKTLHTARFEVGIHDDRKHGWFEHNELGDECGGGLWFDNDGALIDYDGVYELPSEVVQALATEGFDVTYCTETDND